MFPGMARKLSLEVDELDIYLDDVQHTTAIIERVLDALEVNKDNCEAQVILRFATRLGDMDKENILSDLEKENIYLRLREQDL